LCARVNLRVFYLKLRKNVGFVKGWRIFFENRIDWYIEGHPENILHKVKFVTPGLIIAYSAKISIFYFIIK